MRLMVVEEPTFLALKGLLLLLELPGPLPV